MRRRSAIGAAEGVGKWQRRGDPKGGWNACGWVGGVVVVGGGGAGAGVRCSVSVANNSRIERNNYQEEQPVQRKQITNCEEQYGVVCSHSLGEITDRCEWCSARAETGQTIN